MSSFMAGLPGMPSGQTVRTELRGGVMSGAYVLHHFLTVFLMPAAIFVMVFGFGGLLLNPDKAYTTWNWWRLFGAMFIVFLPSFSQYWLGQERKVALTGNAATSMTTYNRAQINAIFAVYMVMIVVLGAWITLLTVWLGVADFGNCSSSAICSGTSASSTPSTGAIMTIVGMGILSICTWILFLGGLYVHAAARDAYNARLSTYFPLAAPIGSGLFTHYIANNLADIGSGLMGAAPSMAPATSETVLPVSVGSEMSL
jgi:hypothetical protein